MLPRRVLIGSAIIALLAAMLLAPAPHPTPSVDTSSAPPTPTAFTFEQRIKEIKMGNVSRSQPDAAESPPTGPSQANDGDPFGPQTIPMQPVRPSAAYTPPPLAAAGSQAMVSSSASPSGRTEAGPGTAMLETLSELQNTPMPFEQRIYGARSTAPSVGPAEATPTAGPTATPTITPTPTLGPVGGQPTGYMMLQLMEPTARESVERQIQILLDSKVMTLYISALVDGTFDKDYQYLASVVRRLNTEGRTLTLALYFSNGPAQRNNEEAFPGGLFNTYEPVNFRMLIRFDNTIKTKFREAVAEAIPVFQLNLSLNPGNKNYAFPMLEDNLDYNSYKAMQRINRAAVKDSAEVMRNPCPGCADDGQNNSDPLGSGLESHNPADLPNLTRRDGIALDGSGFAFPGESFGLPIETVKGLKEQAFARGLRYFGLWRGPRQGLGPGTTTSTPPRERFYEVPTDEQAELEIELLRWGLPPMSR